MKTRVASTEDKEEAKKQKADKWIMSLVYSLYVDDGKIKYREGSKAFSIDEIYKAYCEKFAYTDLETKEDFHKILLESVSELKTTATLNWSQIDNNLSQHEEEILKDVFVVHNGMGKPSNFYFKKFSGKNSKKTVYRLVSKIDQESINKIPNVLKSVTDSGKEKYRDIENQYIAKIEELHKKGILCWNTLWGTKYEPPTENCPPVLTPLPFDKWFQNRLGVLISSKKFCSRDDVKPLSTDKTEYALSHFDLDKIVPGPTPIFDQWSKIMTPDQKEIFLAWIYGIIDTGNNARSCLWLMDDGYTGKSAFLKALNDFIDPENSGSVCSISKDSMDNQFAFSSVYGARLVVYGDCKNSRLVESEKIHSLLGNDMLAIEFKGMTTFHTRLNAKLIVAGNISPAINTAFANEMSRAIVLKLKPAPYESMVKFCQTIDGEIQYYDKKKTKPVYIGGKLDKELLSEMPAVFAKAKEFYDKLCPNKADFIIPQSVFDDMVETCESPEQALFDEFISKHIVIDSSANIARAEVLNKFRDVVSKKEFDFTSFKRYLKNVYRVEEKRMGTIKYFFGIKLSCSESSSEKVERIKELISKKEEGETDAVLS